MKTILSMEEFVGNRYIHTYIHTYKDVIAAYSGISIENS
jgi:hypothetical protein